MRLDKGRQMAGVTRPPSSPDLDASKACFDAGREPAVLAGR